MEWRWKGLLLLKMDVEETRMAVTVTETERVAKVEDLRVVVPEVEGVNPATEVVIVAATVIVVQQVVVWW